MLAAFGLLFLLEYTLVGVLIYYTEQIFFSKYLKQTIQRLLSNRLLFNYIAKQWIAT